MAKYAQFVVSGMLPKNMNTAIEPTDHTAKSVTMKNEKHIEMEALRRLEHIEKIKDKNGIKPNPVAKADRHDAAPA